MANHQSAIKRMHQNEQRRIQNMSYKSSIRTAVKKFLRAAGEKSSDAQQLLRTAISLLDKGVSKGIIHRNTASRKIAGLSKKLQAS
ncbi:MAG: 30S ribosomal protein S20 [Desulfomonilaceae bacterium]